MQIEIRLIRNRLQLTKFQIFQRTLLDFNGTAMKINIKPISIEKMIVSCIECNTVIWFKCYIEIVHVFIVYSANLIFANFIVIFFR